MSKIKSDCKYTYSIFLNKGTQIGLQFTFKKKNLVKLTGLFPNVIAPRHRFETRIPEDPR